MDAMAKCMAAPALDLPLPTPAAVPEERMDADGNVVPRRGRTKKVQRFLLPVPVEPPEQDEQMAGDADAPASIKCDPRTFWGLFSAL
jgi:hypothetical protein